MQDNLITLIKNSARSYFKSIVELRRDLHSHPELSFQEERTAGKVKEFLTAHNVEFTEGWAGHGVVATIKGNTEGRLLMLRADMDALPIHEENDVTYRSLNDGIMHACGHDVHTSCLLGVAAIISEHKHLLNGNVQLIFQPGEEKLPGGASLMINQGLFKKNKPHGILAQHVYPSLPAGHVGFSAGAYMASADELYIKIQGKGGHAATPHLCIDPVLIASRVVIGLQEMISRRKDPMSPAVLSVGRIYSEGGATNVIPDVVFLEGTLRTMNEELRYNLHQLIRESIEHTCKASGASAEIDIRIGYPSLFNDNNITSACYSCAVEFLGQEHVHELPPRMSSEDFAFYLQQVPGTFYRLGTGWGDAQTNHSVHSNQFDIDESALETGMGLMSYLALSGKI